MRHNTSITKVSIKIVVWAFLAALAILAIIFGQLSAPDLVLMAAITIWAWSHLEDPMRLLDKILRHRKNPNKPAIDTLKFIERETGNKCKHIR